MVPRDFFGNHEVSVYLEITLRRDRHACRSMLQKMLAGGFSETYSDICDGTHAFWAAGTGSRLARNAALD